MYIITRLHNPQLGMPNLFWLIPNDDFNTNSDNTNIIIVYIIYTIVVNSKNSSIKNIDPFYLSIFIVVGNKDIIDNNKCKKSYILYLNFNAQNMLLKFYALDSYILLYMVCWLISFKFL